MSQPGGHAAAPFATTASSSFWRRSSSCATSIACSAAKPSVPQLCRRDFPVRRGLCESGRRCDQILRGSDRRRGDGGRAAFAGRQDPRILSRQRRSGTLSPSRAFSIAFLVSFSGLPGERLGRERCLVRTSAPPQPAAGPSAPTIAQAPATNAAAPTGEKEPAAGPSAPPAAQVSASNAAAPTTEKKPAPATPTVAQTPTTNATPTARENDQA